MKTKRNLLAKRALRAPIVITVAGAGMLLGTTGCDSENENECGGDVACNPPSAECPTNEPNASDGCDSGLVCKYGDCGGVPTRTFTCKGGAWEVMEMSCNPPPPECPAEVPAAESACNLPSFRECGYDFCMGMTHLPTTSARCIDGQWNVQHGACNPPPPECPAERPAAGSACTLPNGFECGFGECNGEPIDKAYCTNGAWSFAYGDPCVPQCPEGAPAADSGCDNAGQECRYGDCYGEPTITAQCTDGAWSVAERTCNPPAPTCPEATPAADSACDIVGQECTYGDCYGEPTIFAQCTQMGWSIAERTCNPPPPEP